MFKMVATLIYNSKHNVCIVHFYYQMNLKIFLNNKRECPITFKKSINKQRKISILLKQEGRAKFK